MPGFGKFSGFKQAAGCLCVQGGGRGWGWGTSSTCPFGLFVRFSPASFCHILPLKTLREFLLSFLFPSFTNSNADVAQAAFAAFNWMTGGGGGQGLCQQSACSAWRPCCLRPASPHFQGRFLRRVFGGESSLDLRATGAFLSAEA